MERGVSKGPVAPARSGERHPRTGPSLGAEAPRDPPPPSRPPGLIPAAPRLSAPQSALGEMPPLAPAPRPSSITPGFGPRDPAAPGGGRTGGPERRIPGGARAEPVGHTGEVGAMGKGGEEGGGSVQGVFYPLRDHPGLLSASPSAFVPGIDGMRLEMVGM